MLRRIQGHSNTHNLSEDLNFVGIQVNFGCFGGAWVAENHEAITIQMAPAAMIAIAMFQEVDGPIPFVAPPGIDDLVGVVDHQQRTRAEYRKHRPVFRADRGVAFAFGIDAFQQMERQRTPLGDHAAEEGSSGKIYARIEAERCLDLAEPIGGKVDRMSLHMLVEKGIIRLFVEIDSVPGKQLSKV